MATGLMRLSQLATGTVGPSISGSNISTRVSSRQSQSQRQQALPPALLGPAPAPALFPRAERPGRQRTASATKRAAVLVPVEDEELLASAAPPSVSENDQLELGHLDLHLGTAAQHLGTAAQSAFPSLNVGSVVATAGGSTNGSTSSSLRATPKASPRSHTQDGSTTAAPRSAALADDTASSSVHGTACAQAALEGVPPELHCLLEPEGAVLLPAPGSLDPASLDNSRLDRLVAALGRGRATWRRALMLYEWLKASGHELDDRLCTTLIRVCADHGDAVSALSVYEWMRSPAEAGGAALHPTAYTYTAAMRAALGVGMLDRALQVWHDSQSAGLTPDCRLCITYIELCTRLGQTDKALAMYYQMRDAPPGSPMRPSVHAYTAAMRAATEGGRWMRALGVWEDMRRSSCQPTGHAYAAAISACAAGQDWMRAVALFDDMTARASIRPDVVSCTALVTALAAAGEADKAEAVVQWMQKSGLKPNVRTYTALLTAMGNARQWSRAVRLLFTMQQPEHGSVQPNAYTYSALIKALGEHGQWQLAEAVFEDVETQLRTARAAAHTADSSHSSLTSSSRSAGTTSQQAADRVRVFQRLMAVAAAAEAAQQLSAQVALGGLSAPPTPVSAGPAQVLQSLPLVDSAALSPSSTTQQQQHAAAQAATPRGSSAPDTHSTPTASWAGSQAASSSISQSEAASAGPASPSRQPPSSAPVAIPAADDQARNWSHPSQLNGIQLNLLSSSPEAQSALTQAAAGPDERRLADADALYLASESAAGMSAQGPSWGIEHAAASGGLPAGQYMYTSQISNERREARPSLSASSSSSRIASSGAAAGFSFFSSQPAAGPHTSDTSATHSSNGAASDGHGGSSGAHGHSSAHTPVINEVVCGAMMLAYERAGRWVEAVGVLTRARMLGLTPNTVMFNTAISAAGKAGQLELAEQLFQAAPARDAVTHEIMVTAYGMAARPDKAEQMMRQMVQNGFRPRDFAYCGLIAAHSLAGNPEAALAVRKRMQQAGVAPTVNVYNALLAACERAQRYEQALELLHAMKREGVEPNAVTGQLCQVVGRAGAQTVESQQVAAAALSAVFAAAGGLLIRAGMF